MIKSISLFIILILSLTILYAQNQSDKDLITQLDDLMTQKFSTISPGCVALVIKKGETIYKKAFGKANLELNVPMQPDMIFRIGSITKQYTSIAILQLVEQGKISLKDTIQRFIKDFPYKGHAITIENLLTHTSGIIDYQALSDSETNNQFYYRKDFKPKEIIDFFKNKKLDFIPGSKFAYSNSNYFLLGYIIETVTGERYENYMKQHIFDVAGLSHTYYGGHNEIIFHRTAGYAKYNGKFENADYLSMTIPYAAGALMSNAEDIYKWHQALYAHKLVSEKTLKEALSPYKLSDGTLSEYGYGWIIKTRNETTSIEHSGGIDGFQSDEIYFPQQDIFIVTLYNSLNEGGSDMSFMDLDNDIATLAVGKKLQETIQVAAADLKQYIGVYQSDPKHPAIITLENGQLHIEAKGGGLPKSPLFAKSKNLFFLKVIDAEIEFVKDENEKVIELIVHFKGNKQVAEKVK